MKNKIYIQIKKGILALSLLGFTFGSAYAQYCTPTFTDIGGGDFISYYEVGDIVNYSDEDADNYADYTADFSTDLLMGATYTVYCDVGPDWDEAIKTFIDYDQNGVFEDYEEVGCVIVPNATGGGSYEFTVPFDAVPGTTRLRAICEYNGPCDGLTACFSGTYGEAEDYTVVIIGGDDCEGTPDAGTASSTMETTCASSVFTLSVPPVTAAGVTYQWQSSADGSTYSDIDGATSSSFSTSQTDATWYQCVVTCTASGESSISTAVFVNNECLGCMDETALNYYAEANVDDGSCFYGYTISDCAYEGSLLTVPDGTVELCLTDDGVSTAQPIGFDFPFYETPYSEVYVGANGYMSFNSGLGSACCTGQLLPSATYPNSIFFGQEDFDPNSCTDGDIYTWTQGDPGSQIFVLAFENVPHYPGPDIALVTVQVQLFEATGEIKIVSTEINNDGGSSTMGLNLDGTIAQPVDGRNQELWTAYDECILFSPADAGGGSDCDLVPPTDIYVDGLSAYTAIFHWTNPEGTGATKGTLWELSTGVYRKFTVYETEEYSFAGNLTPSTTYGIRLKSACADGDYWTPSLFSDWYYFTTDPLREGEFAQSIALYPNPNDGNFRIQLNGYESGEAQVIIMNAVGQVMYDANISIDANASVHDISLNLAAGTYIVKVINGSEIVTNTIIVE
ncbi:MAG: GEVED domain-containing protein [Chitinophagales bacterium]